MYRGNVKPPKPPEGKATAQGVTYSWAQPSWGAYRQRSSSLGVQIWAWDIVSEAAVRQAAVLVAAMLNSSTPDIKARLASNNARVAIAGKDQMLWDIPEHRYLISDNSANWAQVRGAGATLWNPTTTVPEEGLLELDSDKYKTENVAVHEIGHMIMNVGMTECQNAAIARAYAAARASGIYDTTQYIMYNEFEYFAEMTQGWFEASTRSDVNAALTTRYRVLAKDAGAASFLYAAYGAGPWRYPDSCPKCRAKWPIVTPRPSPEGWVVQSAADRGCLPVLTPVVVNEVLASTRCDDSGTSCKADAGAGIARNMVGTAAGDGTYSLGSCLKSCGVCKAKSPFTTPCQDTNQYCRDWAANGECTNNPNYMFATCLTSCGICAAYGLDDASSASSSASSSSAGSGCTDLSASCAVWAAAGECANNPGYMLGDPSYNFPGQCLKSCGKC
eukprot:scaffold11.g3852.t1